MEDYREVIMEWSESTQLWIMKEPKDGSFLQELRDCGNVRWQFRRELNKDKPEIWLLPRAIKKEV